MGKVSRHPQEHRGCLHHARVTSAEGLQPDSEQCGAQPWGGAEIYAVMSAASESFGIVAMTEDYGKESEAYLYADASAAIGIANREGLGRVRHLDTQAPWLQQGLKKKESGPR